MTPLSRKQTTFIRSLHRRKGRQEEGCFVVEGERAVSEVASESIVRFLFGTPDREALARVLAPEAPFFSVEDERLFATEQPQGIGAVLAAPDGLALADLLAHAPLLVLDALADPGNVGTIIRTAEWFGIGGIVLLPGTADPWAPKSVRSSMGAIVRCPIGRAGIEEILESTSPIVGLDVGGELTIGIDSMPPRGLYVIGSEAHGISPQLKRAARLAAIPGRGRVESLNVAAAAAILCWELSRLDDRA